MRSCHGLNLLCFISPWHIFCHGTSCEYEKRWQFWSILRKFVTKSPSNERFLHNSWNNSKRRCRVIREILTCIFNLSISERTHPMLPSPLQIKMRNGSKWRKSRKPSSGPVETRSKTCAGFSNCLKRRKNLTPWLSPDFELTKTRSGEKELPRGFTTSHESSTAIEWRHVGGITETLPGPSGHRTSILGRHAVCTVARHHKHRQSCSRSTEPHVLSQWLHFADTGKFPSCHWCGIMRLPSGSSIISLPAEMDTKGNLDSDDREVIDTHQLMLKLSIYSLLLLSLHIACEP